MASIIVKTMPGFEDIAIKEIEILTNVHARKLASGLIKTSAGKISCIEKVRNAESVFTLIKKFRFNGLNDIIINAGKIDFSFIKHDFIVKCHRKGTHDFNSVDIEKNIGEMIFNKGYKVNLGSNEVICIEIINNNCFIGLLIKDGLARRAYRVKVNNQSITPIMAYSMLSIAGYNPSGSLLDPFCKDAVILIEAALLRGKKLYGIDNENNIHNSRINSAMAKSKINFYDINSKNIFKPKSIDFIITILPFVSKKTDKMQIKKLLDEFFKNASIIAKKNITVITRNMKYVNTSYKKYGLKLIHKRKIMTGDQSNFIMVFKP